MIYLLVITYMFLLPITVLIMLWKILDKVEKLSEEKKVESTFKRTHPTIQKYNYDNAFGGKKAYEIYKNKSGLYEPQTPSRGIKIGNKEE